jgi:RNA polymerase sigma factor (sigma-70 family)
MYVTDQEKPVTANSEEVSRSIPSRNDFLANAYKRYSGVLKSFLMRTVEEADAEDLLHEVFLRMSKLQHLTLIDNLQAFLFTTATNLLRDRWRRNNARFAPTLVQFDECDLSAPAADPCEIADWQERLERANRVIRKLPSQPRRAFELSRKQACSYREIAQQLGVSVSMVEKHISATLIQLRAAV